MADPSENNKLDAQFAMNRSMDLTKNLLTSLKLSPVVETSQNAIAILLKSPIVHTGLSATLGSNTVRVPTSRDIPPVVLTNVPPVNLHSVEPYIAQVANLYENRARLDKSNPPKGEDDGHDTLPKDSLSRRNSRTSLSSSSSEILSVLPPTSSRRTASISARKSLLSVPSLTSIPNVYFDDAFNLANPRIFDVVTERSEIVKPPAVAASNNPDLQITLQTPRKALASNAILQEKFSWYLDTVEMHLISAISSASTSFFAALSSLKVLHKEASNSVGDIRNLRIDLKHLDEDMALGRLELARLNQRRQNISKLSSATKQLSNIVRAQLHCEQQFDQIDLEVSLDNISVLGDYVCGHEPNSSQEMPWLSHSESAHYLIDLRGAHALDNLVPRITALRDKIGLGYQQKFAQFLLNDLKHHVYAIPPRETMLRWAAAFQKKKRGSTTAKTASTLTSESLPLPLPHDSMLRRNLSATLIGLKRSNQTLIAAISPFKAHVNKEIKKMIRQNLPSASDDDNESINSTSTRSSRINLSQQEKSAILARNLRALDASDTEQLLAKTYCAIIEFLKRLQYQSKLLLDISSDGIFVSKPPSQTDKSNFYEQNGLSYTPISQEQLHETQCQVADVSQAQLVKILNVRGVQTRSYDLQDFIRYFTLNKMFADECEALSGRSGTLLISVIKNQISDYLVNFAQNQRTLLSDLMEKDRWDARDFSSQDRKILNQILDCSQEDTEELLRITQIWEPRENLQQNQDIDTDADGPTQTAVTGPVMIQNECFTLPQSAIILVHGVARFVTLIACMPNTTTDVSPLLLDYLKTFNSKTCQLVLGAGATRSAAGLEKINTKHLALASRALAFSAALIPYIRNFVGGKQGMSIVGVGDYDSTKELMTEMLDNFHDKLVEIMAHRAVVHTRDIAKVDWDNLIGRNGPTKHIEMTIKETLSLQRVLAKHMPDASVESIVTPVFEKYKVKWGEAFKHANPKTASGKAMLLKDAEAFLNKLGYLYNGQTVGEYLVMIVKAKLPDLIDETKTTEAAI